PEKGQVKCGLYKCPHCWGMNNANPPSNDVITCYYCKNAFLASVSRVENKVPPPCLKDLSGAVCNHGNGGLHRLENGNIVCHGCMMEWTDQGGVVCFTPASQRMVEWRRVQVADNAARNTLFVVDVAKWAFGLFKGK